jgi:hypothetical protein
MFPLTPPAPEAAEAKLVELFGSLREAIAAINLLASPGPSTSKTSAQKPPPAQPDETRLEATVARLTAELERARARAEEQAAQTRALVAQLAEAPAEDAALAGYLPPVEDASVELMTAPAVDEEKRRLEARVRELEEERRRFTEEAVRLGQERERVRRERVEMEEERRRERVGRMLEELPPTPVIEEGEEGGEAKATRGLKVEKKARRAEKEKVDVDDRMEYEELMSEAGPSRAGEAVRGDSGDFAVPAKNEKHSKQSRGSPAKKPRSPIRVGAAGRKSRHHLRRSSSSGLGSLLSPTKGESLISPLLSSGKRLSGGRALNIGLLPP